MKDILKIHLTKEYLLDQFLFIKSENMHKYKIVDCKIELHNDLFESVCISIQEESQNKE